MRIRQIALAANDLNPVLDDLQHVLDLDHVFADEGVGFFGLHNGVMPVGDTFLEVVSPKQEGTSAGRFLERMGGDAGYMVILQTDAFEAARRRVDELGVDVVWETELDDIRSMHLHPRQTGGALFSIDDPRPPESWRWGGPGWSEARPSDLLGSIRSAVFSSPDPEALAARHAEVLGLESVPGTVVPSLALEGGELRYEQAAEGGIDRFVAFEIVCENPAAALKRAHERGVPVMHDDTVQMGGVGIRLVTDSRPSR